MSVSEVKVQQLSDYMKGHLAWYLDNKTCIGMITAAHICRGQGEWKEITLMQVFTWAGLNKRQAMYHSNKLFKFKQPQ